MSDEARGRLVRYTQIALTLMVVAIALSLMGFVDINPRIFAENFAYFLTVVAGLYFIFLYFFAGLDAAERKNITLLFLLFIAAAAFWSGFDQSGGSLNIFARDYTDLVVSGFEVPVSWIQFVNPIFVVIFAPMFAAVWAHLARRNLDPSLPVKFAIGLIFMAISFMIMLAAVALAMETAPIGMRWLLLTYLLQTWGELTLSPIGLSAFSRYAPKRYVGQMFGLWFLASAIGGVLAGLLGGEAMDEGLASMSPVFTFMIEYYLAIAVGVLIAAWLLRRKSTG
jgi:POT family proton-dependent oligopeptide transporter